MRELVAALRVWILHKLSTHCDECDNSKQCTNCEYLRLILEQERAERSRLLSLILSDNHESNEVDPFTNVKTYKPWNVRRAELERQARESKSKATVEN